jgi:hypothetical protein
MLRALFYAIPFVLAIYAVVDCLQTPEEELHGLPRIGWLVLIVFFPIVGPAAWLVSDLVIGHEDGAGARQRVSWPAGPGTGARDQQRPARRVIAPDDDPEFLSRLGRTNSEQDALLEQWERELRRPEDDPRGEGPGDEAGPESGGTAPRT